MKIINKKLIIAIILIFILINTKESISYEDCTQECYWRGDCSTEGVDENGCYWNACTDEERDPWTPPYCPYDEDCSRIVSSATQCTNDAGELSNCEDPNGDGIWTCACTPQCFSTDWDYYRSYPPAGLGHFCADTMPDDCGGTCTPPPTTRTGTACTYTTGGQSVAGTCMNNQCVPNNGQPCEIEYCDSAEYQGGVCVCTLGEAELIRIYPYQTMMWLDSDKDGIEEATDEYITSTYNRYDNYGNVLEIEDAKGSIISTDFSTDYKNALPSSSWVTGFDGTSYGNTANPTWKKEYYSNGLLKKATDRNGLVFEYQYDSLQRLSKIFFPGDDAGSPSIEYYYHSGTGTNDPSYVKKTTKLDGVNNKYMVSYEFYDGFGRLIQTQYKKDENGNYIVKIRKYRDDNMKLDLEYESAEATTNGNYITPEQLNPGKDLASKKFIYYNDPLFRVKEVIYYPSENRLKYSYGSSGGFPTITIEDEEGKKIRHTYDLFNNLIKVEQGI